LELPRSALATALSDFPDLAPRLFVAIQAAIAVARTKRTERRVALHHESSESSSDDEAGSPFMVQLIRARSTATAQHRMLKARLAAAAAHAAELEAGLDSALALAA